ncbi:thioredoxin domain-containing protein [Microbacterium sp. P07]|uniref:thioredoxin domain-containing protein n=1 Tax=Microbacterium sp. P07 TaxID=3366952 RepID=UPI003744F19F
MRAHADNPVEWFPWGPEAFAEAARRGVPVLVSIGYSTCHWCHVMARESFQDDATAALINDGFVAVKVDREEHPDVDAAYLDAASAFTPHLGWPLTVFTTPEGRVFYAGTYWPGEPRPPLPAFREVLGAVREAWTDRREEVERTGAALRDALAEAARASSSSSGTPDLDQLAEAARGLTAREDPDYGGFAAGSGLETPKFPTVPALRFLQSPALADASAAAVARRAVDAMASSELHDPVDGGFFRYATRRDWSVPHYERMLTDNAGLVEVALDAGRPDVAADAARFLIDVLQQPSGGFAAAQDSESIIDGERDEGGYYARDADGRAKLAPPSLDGKIVTAWNGLAIGALARAGVRLGDDRLIEAARWAADAVLETNIGDDGMLRRASLDEIVSRAAATLEDYGGLVRGLVLLSAATGEAGYAVTARGLVDACLSDAGVRVPGGGDPVLVAQGMAVGGSDTDGASPSPTAAFAAGALGLWHLGAGEKYRDAAASTIARVAETALEQPLGHGAILEAAASLASPPRQVVVVGAPGSALAAAAARSIRADVVAFVTAEQAGAFATAGFSLFEAKTTQAGRPTAYDCRAFVCRLPVTDLAALVALA